MCSDRPRLLSLVVQTGVVVGRCTATITTTNTALLCSALLLLLLVCAGFPEDFVPFLEYDEAVNAKY